MSNSVGEDPMPFGLGAFVFIGLYLLSLIGIGILGKKAQKESSLRDFYLGGQGVGFVVLWLTLFATHTAETRSSGSRGSRPRLGLPGLRQSSS